MKQITRTRYLPYLLWLLPVAGFYSLLIRFGQNIPSFDDFSATLHFVYAVFFTGKTQHEQWLLLLSQHNEHRIAISRLTTLLLYGLTGHINLNVLLWMQQLFWLCFVGLVVRLAHSVRVTQSAWLGLPVFLLLFHPNTYDTILHVWGGSQTYPMLLFTFLSLWALDRSLNSSSYWLLIAVASAGMAMYSFGNGFLVWLGGLVYLFYVRQFKLLMGWLAMAGLMLGAYLWHYEQPVHHESALTAFQPIGLLKFVLLFPGASFMAHWPTQWLAFPNLIVCYSIGLASWSYTLYLLIINYGKRRPLLFSLLIVALSTGLLIAVSRSGYGSGGALVSRYQIFTNLVPLLLFLIWADQTSGRIQFLLPLASLLVIVHGATLWQLWPMLDREDVAKTAGLQQWAQHRTPTLCVTPEQQSFATDVLNRCEENQIFIIPAN